MDISEISYYLPQIKSVLASTAQQIHPYAISALTVITAYLGYGCLLLGSFFIITSAVGMIRMPDFYTRLHAAGVGDSVGAPLILLGLALHSGFTLFTLKLLLLGVFFLITSPTACHALGQAAKGCGLEHWTLTKKKE